jgi:hypothetical protein
MSKPTGPVPNQATVDNDEERVNVPAHSNVLGMKSSSRTISGVLFLLVIDKSLIDRTKYCFTTFLHIANELANTTKQVFQTVWIGIYDGNVKRFIESPETIVPLEGN